MSIIVCLTLNWYSVQIKPFTKKNKNNLLIGFSIIALVIIKMHALLLVEDCIISGCNCLMQSDYNRSINFQNGSLAFFNTPQDVIIVTEEKTSLKSTKDAKKFGVTLFKGEL